MVEVFDERCCSLGEGPIWHPKRGSLLWFDINAGRLLERQGDVPRYWQFEGAVSAAGVLPDGRVLIASRVALQAFDLETGQVEVVEPLEAQNPATRSNDGRPDPWGGFWIGTMAYAKTQGAGAIYRLYQGEKKLLFPDITIPNAICFSPDRSKAYFTDTPTRLIWRQALDEHGWPVGEREVFADLTEATGAPDGAVCDRDGYVWNARWGSGEVVRHAPDGRVDKVFKLPVSHVTCPAFGGADASTLYATTAYDELNPAQRAAEPLAGAVFKVTDGVPGHFEPEVIL